jgi:hypothetical protein
MSFFPIENAIPQSTAVSSSNSPTQSWLFTGVATQAVNIADSRLARHYFTDCFRDTAARGPAKQHLITFTIDQDSSTDCFRASVVSSRSQTFSFRSPCLCSFLFSVAGQSLLLPHFSIQIADYFAGSQIRRPLDFFRNALTVTLC